jgi:microcompartment protein CcmL/EutN
MSGRVLVKITGPVKKGQRLVSAGNGMARAAQPGEITSFNVVGRALANKLDDGVGKVEAVVTII